MYSKVAQDQIRTGRGGGESVVVIQINHLIFLQDLFVLILSFCLLIDHYSLTYRDLVMRLLFSLVATTFQFNMFL